MKQTDSGKEVLPIVVEVDWIDGLRFVARDNEGHSIVMDVTKEHGGEGSGFGPMQLLLAALGGCSGVDITGIMNKQRQKLEHLRITVSGRRVAEPPRVYNKIHVSYRVKGKYLKEKSVRRAIELSQERYCSVAATLKAKAEVSFDYEIQQA